MATPRFVAPGQPLVISASVWNRVQSMLQKFENGAVPAGIWASKIQSVGQRSAQAITTTVKNATDHDFGVFEAVPLGDTAVDYSAGDNEMADFQTRSTFTTDGGRDKTLNWGIALEAIKQGNVGRVLLSGLIPARVTKWKGEDNMVDFDNLPEGEDDWKLYTSAAGCAVIKWMEDVEDEEEGWAILHVLGYRTKEPACWAVLDSPVQHISTPEADSARLASILRVKETGFETGVKGRYGTNRKVMTRCFKMLVGKQIANEVKIDPDPVTGLWIIEDALECPVNVP